MSNDHRDVLELLRYELNYVEQGGLDRSGPGQGAAENRNPLPSPFQDTLTCLNFGEPLRPHACHECALYDFVPAESRSEDVPCHFIPLDPAGHTIAELLRERKVDDLKRCLKVWLRATIARMSGASVAV